uniref:EF-hand domain-containing protein n=1 Tax=Leersia perrieri TaxID=77586 RepID=A0A0D9XVX0_9ORYZ
MPSTDPSHPLEVLLVAARGALVHLHLPFPGSKPNKHKQPDFRSLTTCSSSKPLQAADPPRQLDFLLCIAFDTFTHNLHLLVLEHKRKQFQPHLIHRLHTLIHGKKAAFLSNLGFAKTRLSPSPSPWNLQQLMIIHTDYLFACSASHCLMTNVERLRSTLSTLSLAELIELVLQLVARSTTSHDAHPDKKKLFSVHDFFRYAEFEGKRLFEELDRGGDGQVTLEDLEVAMRKRRLPRMYARDFLRRTKSNLFSKSIGWKQFLSLMEQKEPTILRAYTTLCLSKSGTLHKNQILTSLKSAGLPANEDNAAAMLRYLNADSEESISYSHFRNFMLLLPSERIEDDPRHVSKHLRFHFQISYQHFHKLGSEDSIGVLSPQFLVSFQGIFEASKLVLKSVAPTLPDIQVQSLSSFCSTILGTAVRIPCEVLKQRLQAGIFNNVGEAIVWYHANRWPKAVADAGLQNWGYKLS